LKVSKNLKEHVKEESVFKHRSQIVRPEQEQKSILEWEHRDDLPKCWARRVTENLMGRYRKIE